MLALGVIGDPNAKQVMVDLGQAKYLIDTLVMLRDKMNGNMTPEEEGQLTQAVSELQQFFVLRSQQAQEAQFKQAGIDPTDPNSLKGGPQQ
jgi:hypothetical protein